MSVNYSTPSPELLRPVDGVRLGMAEAGIRKSGRRDLALLELAEDSRVAGVFTKNRFCAAPVQVCREHLAQGHIRALVINTGIANAGTGEQGMAAAQKTCQEVAKLLEIAPTQVLPFSTGVILEQLPVARLVAALPTAHADLRDDGWHDAAHVIMTTDTVAKAASRSIDIGGRTVTLTGMSKGSGMIRPNMATLLSFVATDAHIAQDVLNRLVTEAADLSFNSITVDGDTSTNDSFIVMATGCAENPEIVDEDSAEYEAFREALIGISIELAQAIVRDGEGATKFIEVTVEAGQDKEECRTVAYAIAQSPLVKTAFFASDPNLGRILAAIGYADVDGLDVDRLTVSLASGGEEVLIAENGGVAPGYREEDGARIMQRDEITVRVVLGRGSATATIWSCDFSYDYVKINAEYRS